MKEMPVFHLGMTRCASTFLQLEIFPSLSRRQFVRPGTGSSISALGYAHLSQMDKAHVDRWKGYVGKSVLLSQEEILCSKRAYAGRLHWDDNIVVTNLRELYGEDCRILVVIRRQDMIIDSMIRYKQRYLSDARMFMVDYPVNRSVFGALKFESLFDKLIASYNYYRSIVPLLPLFGKDRIWILPYEQLVSDKDLFYSRLGECLDEDLTRQKESSLPRRNTTSHKYSDLPKGYVPMGHVMRKLNNLSGYRLEKFLPSQKEALGQRQCEEILKIFEADNRRLDELFGLNLKALGYY